MLEITGQPLDPERVTNLVRKDGNGAVVTFLGTTRDNFEGKRVLRLEYEAYYDMALEKAGRNMPGDARGFGVEDVAISHRTGLVDIGQISLIVAVAAPHRRKPFTPVTRWWTGSKR